MKHITKLSAFLSCAAAAAVLSCSAFAENNLYFSEPLNDYALEAKRLNYSGELAEFSVDLPASFCEMAQAEGENADALLFYGESEAGYISCAFHDDYSGFEGEVEAWKTMETAEILSLTDMQGMPVSLVRLNIYDSFFAYIADFPIGEHSWVNITMDFPEEDMDKVREDITEMVSTFTREVCEVPEANTSEPAPDTGVELFSLAVPTAAAAALLLARKRR